MVNGYYFGVQVMAYKLVTLRLPTVHATYAFNPNEVGVDSSNTFLHIIWEGSLTAPAYLGGSIAPQWFWIPPGAKDTKNFPTTPGPEGIWVGRQHFWEQAHKYLKDTIYGSEVSANILGSKNS